MKYLLRRRIYLSNRSKQFALPRVRRSDRWGRCYRRSTRLLSMSGSRYINLASTDEPSSTDTVELLQPDIPTITPEVLPASTSRSLRKDNRMGHLIATVRLRPLRVYKGGSLLVRQIFHSFKSHSLMMAVLLPWFICLLYLSLMKTPLYEGSAKILIEDSNRQNQLMVNLGFLGNNGGGVGGSPSNAVITKDYLLSKEALDAMDKALGWTDHYASRRYDWLTRLSSSASEHQRLWQYGRMVKVDFDPETSVIYIASLSEKPEFAEAVVAQLLKQARQFANRISNTLASEQYRFSEKQMSEAKDKLFKAERDILQFQNEHQMVDPKHTIELVSEVMAGLKKRLVEKQTELIALSSFMSKESSKIIALREEIDALKTQVQRQTDLLSGSKGSQLNSVYADYKWLEIQLKFAASEYEASKQALALAKVNLDKQQQVVVEIAKPSVSEESEYPRIFYDSATLLVILLVVYGVVRMTYLIVREHVD